MSSRTSAAAATGKKKQPVKLRRLESHMDKAPSSYWGPQIKKRESKRPEEQDLDANSLKQTISLQRKIRSLKRKTCLKKKSLLRR